jgi:two-component system, cell cycle response regulator
VICNTTERAEMSGIHTNMTRADARRLQSWLAPDPALTGSGLEGELLIARTRMLLASVLLIVPLIGVLRANGDHLDVIALAGAASLVGLSYAVWKYIRYGGAARWVPFVTSLFDVTLVSAISIGYLIGGRAEIALNSRLLFPVYFLALAATCLRYDIRICLATGITAMVQYALFAIIATSTVSPVSLQIQWGDHAGRLLFLAAATALAVVIVDRARRLRLVSTQDALTGLYNRAYFDERVAEELMRARRYNRPLAIAVLDLDNFKDVNDRYGHSAGDECLKRFAQVLTRSFRRTDIVARYGGEEFAIAMPETDAAESEGKLEQIRSLVESTPMGLSDGTAIRLTFSAGIAQHPDDGPATLELVKLGDNNLLSAKRTGRNRVITRNSGPVKTGT